MSKSIECQSSNTLNTKLRLERANISSISKSPKKVALSQDEIEQEMEIREESSHSDDSLLDFKSPKSDIFTRSKLQTMRSNARGTNVKPKVTKKRKERKANKQATSKKELLNSGQTVIESSFFKSKGTPESGEEQDNAKLGHVCPLCFKIMKNATAQALHMKTCAVKHNISTKKLFEAKELQERQAAERASLGLLSAPVLQNKKRPVPHRTNSNECSDLELALAISRSLHEREELWVLSDPTESDQLTSTQASKAARDDCNGTLQNFGFMTNKPKAIKRKGKLVGPTILQTRDQAERERLLTERIAEVLMGDDTVTQALNTETSNNEPSRVRVVIKSQRLRKIQQIDQKLWDKTRLSPNQKNFYVRSLAPHVTKPEKQSNEHGFGNREVSKSPDKRQDTSDNHNISENQDNSSMFPTEKHYTETLTENDSISSTSEKTNSMTKDKFIDGLVSDWGNALNNSAFSDVIVFVEKGKRIWAHRLVLSVRCSNILLDITSNDDATTFSAKEMIRWPTIPHSAALTFLEFIYCGTIKTNSQVLNDDKSLLSVRCLARKYKVKELFNYLKMHQKTDNVRPPRDNNTRKKETTISSDLNLRRSISELTMKEYSNLPKADNTPEVVHSNKNLTSLSAEGNFSMTYFNDANTDKTYLSQPIGLHTELDRSPRNSVSPDLFDDSETVRLCDSRKSNNRSLAENNSMYSDNELILSSINFDSRFSNSKSLTPKQNLSETVRPVSTVESTRKVECRSSKNDLLSSSLPLNEISDSSIIGTPKSTKFNRSSMSSSTLNARPKGNLTLFIERVQKENAKSICDSDSDVDSVPQVCPAWKRNPFNVNKYDDSMCTPPCNKEPQKEMINKRRHALSMLEDDIRINAIKNSELYNSPPKRINDEEVNSADITLSLASKAIKRKCSETLNSSMISQSSMSVKDISMESEETTDTMCRKLTQNISKERSSVSDMDTDEDDISMYSKYKKNRIDNSIVKYRDLLLNTHKSKDSVLAEKSSPMKRKTDLNDASKFGDKSFTEMVNGEEIIVLSDWESDDSTTSTLILPKKNNNGQIRRETECSQQRTSCSPEGINISKTASLGQNNTNRTHISNIGNEYNTTIYETTPIDPNIYDAETDTENESNSQARNKVKDVQTHENSSRDLKERRMNTGHHANSNHEEIQRNVSSNVSEVCMEDVNFGVTCFDNLDTDVTVNVDNNCYNAEYSQERKSFNSSPISISCSPDQDSHDIETTSKRCRASNNKLIETRDRSSGNVESVHAECSKSDCVPVTSGATNLRKSKRSSLSDDDLCTETMGGKSEDTRKVSNSTPKRRKTKSSNDFGQKLEYVIVDRDVTPPPDYNAMETPELHVNLRKYGLKLHKRNAAIKLLTYIYDQLHPLIPIGTEKEGEVNENTSGTKSSPIKRGSSKRKDAGKENIEYARCLNRSFASQSSNVSTHRRDSIRAMEMELNRSQSGNEDETESDLGTATNVKEAFIRLARKNKELYNKILTYEPLDIQALHAMLKAEGFKCKLNNLMDFLDEQCITFQLLEKNGKTRTRSRPFVSKQ